MINFIPTAWIFGYRCSKNVIIWSKNMKAIVNSDQFAELYGLGKLSRARTRVVEKARLMLLMVKYEEKYLQWYSLQNVFYYSTMIDRWKKRWGEWLCAFATFIAVQKKLGCFCVQGSTSDGMDYRLSERELRNGVVKAVNWYGAESLSSMT